MPRNDANQHAGYPPGPSDRAPEGSPAPHDPGTPDPPVVTTHRGDRGDQAQAEEARATKVSGHEANPGKRGAAADRGGRDADASEH